MSNDRKADHIELALAAQTALAGHDSRFTYEPLLSAHPEQANTRISFLNKEMHFPLWISSMTGGTAEARRINGNLARACREFGLGMGLGSCRNLLFSNTNFADFDWRSILGNDRPFFANLGIAQVEQLITMQQEQAITDMLGKLRTDGLIIHVNPLQEWFQPEGDWLKVPPIDTIERLLSVARYPIIIKEVGQGMGKESLRRLLQLPLAAIEFAAFGGTNFTKLELHRNDDMRELEPLINIGQTATQMLHDIREISDSGSSIRCRQLIVSGGVSNSLDGYYYTGISRLPAIFGMASKLLKPAAESYEALQQYIHQQIELYLLARAFLKINIHDPQ